jgi:hypothetical protein
MYAAEAVNTSAVMEAEISCAAREAVKASELQVSYAVLIRIFESGTLSRTVHA